MKTRVTILAMALVFFLLGASVAEEKTSNEENAPAIKIMSEAEFYEQMKKTPSWVSDSALKKINKIQDEKGVMSDKEIFAQLREFAPSYTVTISQDDPSVFATAEINVDGRILVLNFADNKELNFFTEMIRGYKEVLYGEEGPEDLLLKTYAKSRMEEKGDVGDIYHSSENIHLVRHYLSEMVDDGFNGSLVSVEGFEPRLRAIVNYAHFNSKHGLARGSRVYGSSKEYMLRWGGADGDENGVRFHLIVGDGEEFMKVIYSRDEFGRVTVVAYYPCDKDGDLGRRRYSNNYESKATAEQEAMVKEIFEAILKKHQKV